MASFSPSAGAANGLRVPLIVLGPAPAIVPFPNGLRGLSDAIFLLLLLLCRTIFKSGLRVPGADYFSRERGSELPPYL